MLAHRAHELDLEKDPHFNDIMQFTYLQVMAKMMNNHMRGEADSISADEFEKYYKEHAEEFEQVMVQQLYIPKRRQQDSESESPHPAKSDATAEEAAMKAEAEKIRGKAVVGEDFEKLEQEAYTFAGDPDSAPDTEANLQNRASLGPFAKIVFGLKSGEISELVPSDDDWIIFKVVSRQMMARDQAKKIVADKRMSDAMKALRGSVNAEFDNAYFSSSNAPTAPAEKP